MASFFNALGRRLLGWSREVIGRDNMDRRAAPLSVVDERERLKQVRDVTAPARGEVAGPGLNSVVAPAVFVDEAEFRPQMSGRSGGEALPQWHDGSGGLLRAEVSLNRVLDVFHAPAFGALVDLQGQVFRTSIAEAVYFSPTLAALPGARTGREGVVFQPPDDVPSLPAATVFVAWGGLHNYGHFLLDCMSSLAVVDEQGALERFPAISPPLPLWARELLSLARFDVQELNAPLVRVKDALFTSCMDHFLHAPNTPLHDVRRRIFSAAPASGPGGRRLYLSRRNDRKRVMINEAALEEALRGRGFTVVKPEALPVGEQIKLFRDAEVIVAASGAGLANLLFAAERALVFEILPANIAGVWARNLCELVSLRWHGFFCRAPLEEAEASMEGVARPGMAFTYELPLASFLSFLDERL